MSESDISNKKKSGFTNVELVTANIFEVPKPTLIITADGGSRGNPGKSACAFAVWQTASEDHNVHSSLIKLDKPDFIGGKFLGIQTNNYAEWQGVLCGLEMVLTKFLDIKVVYLYLDSELVVKQLQGQYKVKKAELKLLYDKVKLLEKKIGKVITNHIYRENNFVADIHVNKILDEN